MRRLLTVPKICVENINDGTMDKYTAGIELSNACRQFYVSRLKAAGKIKERLELADSGVKPLDVNSNNDDRVKVNDVNEAKASRDQKVEIAGKSRIQQAMNVLKTEMVRYVFKSVITFVIRNCNFFSITWHKSHIIFTLN